MAFLHSLRTAIHSGSTEVRSLPEETGASLLPFWLSDGVTSTSIHDVAPLALPAFWAGVKLRADLISTLGLGVEDADGHGIAGPLPPIVTQPNPMEDRTVTLQKIETSLIQHGEAIAVLGDFDSLGFPNVLAVVDPAVVSLSDDGQTYTVSGTDYERSEILHLIGFALPGERRGIGVLDLHRKWLEGELTAAQYGQSFFARGATPSAVLSITDGRNYSPDQIASLKSEWISRLSNGRVPIVLPPNVEAKPFGISSKDAQWIESRQLAVADIANMVGVPAKYLNWQGTTRTYANVTDERRDLLEIYLRGSVYRIERAFSGLIPSDLTVKFDAGSFLRLNPKETAETLRIEGGFLTVDEMREINGRPPLPDGKGQILGAQAFMAVPEPTPEEENDSDTGEPTE